MLHNEAIVKSIREESKHVWTHTSEEEIPIAYGGGLRLNQVKPIREESQHVQRCAMEEEIPIAYGGGSMDQVKSIREESQHVQKCTIGKEIPIAYGGGPLCNSAEDPLLEQKEEEIHRDIVRVEEEVYGVNEDCWNGGKTSR